MKNTNKGITLIALVITIIVMLILVGVTISMAVNGGLFDYAGQAAKGTNDAMKAEGQLINDIIDEYIKPNLPETETAITAATMQSDLKSYLGKPVNYGITYEDASTYGNGEWEIFYADGEHIYLITKGHLASAAIIATGYNGTSDFTATNLSSKYPAVKEGLFNKTYDPTSEGSELKYTSTNDNMKRTQYLLDSTVWSTYANDYAEWAIGAPTFELFVNSYNAYYPDKALTLETLTISNSGYDNPLSSTNSVPQDTYLNHYTSTNSSPSYYALACPSSEYNQFVRSIDGNGGKVFGCGYAGNSYQYRPVICLDSDVQITWDSTNSEYTLSRVAQ